MACPNAFFRPGILLQPIQSKFTWPQKDQQVVGILQDKIINRVGFGSNYKKLDITFRLDENVRVFIYQKINEKFNENDLRDLSNHFIELYPKQKIKFLFPPDFLKTDSGIRYSIESYGITIIKVTRGLEL